MRILFAGHKERGVVCLEALIRAGHHIVGVIAPQGDQEQSPASSVAAAARRHGLEVIQPANVNHSHICSQLRHLRPELTVLAGFGQIVRHEFIDVAPFGCINLHAGKLPEYRGSSPMNWALINGERQFTISVIQVDLGVDTGDVLAEQTFEIGPEDTIADLHAQANQTFPRMLVEVIARILDGSVMPRRQNEALAGYYPLRFPEDGLVLWDLLTAEQIHNRVRALTDPYPGAFTFWRNRTVKLLHSQLPTRRYYGQPGRVYQKTSHGLLVGAADHCIWIDRAVFLEMGTDAIESISRYESFATVRQLAMLSAKAAVDYDR